MNHSREVSRVNRLRSLFARPAESVTFGIGDDAAVLSATAARGGSLVWTVDSQVEGTHFRTEWVSWEDIGWRSYMAAASDLASMGAEPVAALSSLVLAPSVDDVALDALTRGQAAAADEIGAPVVGGNLARGTETSITTTLLGRCQSPVLRAGARPGDRLWLAGAVGLARAGLALFEQNMGEARMQDDDTAVCIRAWRRPVARVVDGRALVGVAHACIDVSDGLAHDAWQLAEASGVGLILDEVALLEAGGESLITTAHITGRDPLELALFGGEDYALLAASPFVLEGFLEIGTVVAHDEHVGAGRLAMQTPRGRVPLEPRGFDHFA